MKPEPLDAKSIFAKALDYADSKKRAEYLDEACGNNETLREEVESLLISYEQVGGLLPSLEVDAAVTIDSPYMLEVPGTVIGRYKLLEKIGEGGMAVVYMAEQEKPLRRRVALKIIKLGMDTKQVIARFEVERQALAVMDHPNIAKVLDAGSTETGRPYFVMELVRGVSITDYCDKNRLTTKERLDLFIQVCNAVQHAHQKGIIHRDIKPSNVMVTLHDGKPVPKVIDFGIAKATSQRLTEKTLFTRYAQMIGTPAYMSPEQAEMSGLDVDTRTDIYSLGVLLYELLTGTTPFGDEELREAGYIEMQKIIRETDPVKPSTKLSTLGDALASVAEHRKANPDLLRKLLSGDLDWIVMKSLEKDRTRRYDTAAELVVDIARHVNHEPVLAGPPSQIYRLRKFIRRHRTHAIGAMMVALLLAGMVVISAMYIQAHNRGEEAEFLKHKDILSKAMEFRSRGQLQEAMNKVETMLSSRHVGPEARLLRARLILDLHGPADALKELEELIKERDEIACQAHLLLAGIYLESASGVPEKTEEYQQKAKEHQQKGEKLFSESAEAYFNQAMIVGTVTKTLEFLNKAVELAPGHYPSRKARALAYYALRDYRSMERDAVAMTTLRDWDSLGYSLLGISLRETENLADAVRYHNRAIEISPDEAELYDQRRQTYLRMANYEQALLDARKCVGLEPKKGIYHFHRFCALVATGRYDEATVEYDRIIESGLMSKWHLDLSVAKYVSDTLDMGLLWYPPESIPEGAAFLAMHEAAEIYLQLAKKAKRVVPEGFFPTWSPDGTELAYSRGILSFSGVEILNLESGKTRLLTIPGHDPVWSPDGHYIAFNRHRQHILLTDIPTVTTEREAKVPPFGQREIWIIKADGTGEPSFLTRGYWQQWSRDSKRVFYRSAQDGMVCSISIEDHSKQARLLQSPALYPSVSPDEKYVAFGQLGSERKIVDISTKAVVARWIAPLVQGRGHLNWSPDGQELSMGAYDDSGLWIYSMKEKKASKVLSGSFGLCSWSSPDIGKFAAERVYNILHHEIWVANLDPNVSTAEALGPGLTIEEYCQEMVDFYTRRINVDPENAGYYLSRAECYMHLGEQEETLADLERYADIVKDPPKIVRAYTDLTDDQVLAHPQIALQRFRRVHEINPGGLFVGIGLAHYGANQWEEAIAALTNAIKFRREACLSARVYLLLSMAHWQSGNKAEAMNWYNRAIECIQDSKADASVWWPLFHSYYLKAVELMGIKAKEFHRKAPLTGLQILRVTAQADNSYLDMTVEHILDGNDLSDADRDRLLEHGERPEDMWLSETGPTSGWIEFDLGGVYELGSILVWNYNEKCHTKRGVKRADISVWTQDNDWQKIIDDFEFAEAEGSFDYDEPILVKFGGVKAQKVRFNELISLGDEEYVGLSEVRFFQSRGPEATRPHPANGVDISVSTEAKLSWMPGEGIKAHKVYFGTNPDSLRHLDQIEEPNSADMPELRQRQRYFWRVDVVKSDGSEVKGDLWTFTTGRMVGWWKFDETKGETVIDSSGNSLNGKFVGDPNLVPGRIGKAIRLNGLRDHILLPDNLCDSSDFTFSAWINWEGGQAWQRIFDFGNGTTNYMFLTPKSLDDTLRFAIKTDGFNNEERLDTSQLPVGYWVHLAATLKGNTGKLFVNGSVADQETITLNPSDINALANYIGRSQFPVDPFFKGFVDDVRIYSYALSEAEVKELYAGRGPGPNKRPE